MLVGDKTRSFSNRHWRIRQHSARAPCTICSPHEQEIDHVEWKPVYTSACVSHQTAEPEEQQALQR